LFKEKPVKTRGIMINLENISFDHCIKCTICTGYCPVAKVTHLYPGPKQSGPDLERLRIKNQRLVDASLKYCNNCKRCEIACPSDVKIADIIGSAKWKYSKKELSLRDFLLSRTDLMGRVSTFFSPIVNFFTRLSVVKFFLDVFLNIPSKRKFPKYAYKTFRQWFSKNRDSQENFERKIVYFHGCYVNYNDHDLGKAAVAVLNALKIGVVIAREKCCGVPLIANSYFKKACKNANHNIKTLGKAVESSDMKIISSSSSCTFALKYEYANLLELDNSPIADRTEYITEIIYQEFEKGNIPKMKPVNIKAAYHAPCHLERMGSVIYTIGILKKIPGLELKLLHSECCGMSGTYGFKKECYQISQDIGSDIFKKIDKIKPDLVITDCETCKWQIEENTVYETIHPVTLLSRALEANNS